MSSVLANWKTSLAGVVLIAVGILSAFFDVHFPGFTMDSGAAITMGLGLLVAKDAGTAVKAAIVIAFAPGTTLIFSCAISPTWPTSPTKQGGS